MEKTYQQMTTEERLWWEIERHVEALWSSPGELGKGPAVAYRPGQIKTMLLELIAGDAK